MLLPVSDLAITMRNTDMQVPVLLLPLRAGQVSRALVAVSVPECPSAETPPPNAHPMFPRNPFLTNSMPTYDPSLGPNTKTGYHPPPRPLGEMLLGVKQSQG